MRRGVQHIRSAAVAAMLVATPLTYGQSSGARAATDSPARQALVVTLSEALQSFDRGSALLTNAPDQALTAFREARDKFQAVVDAGVENGRLYYNLGNAHARLGEVGRAIAAYRRAQRLIPGDEQLKANLRFARSLTRDHIEAGGKRALMETILFWHHALPLRLRLTVGLVFYGAFWVLLAARVLSPRYRLPYVAPGCLVIWLAMLVSVVVDISTRGTLTEGVLVANDVVVRKGNGEGYDAEFKQPLHEGVEFKLVEQRGGWIQLELPDGHRGWVRRREAALF